MRSYPDLILKDGDYKTFKARNQMGTVAYNEYMGNLNPYTKCYMELFEEWEKTKEDSEKLKKDLEHYRTRYMELAKMVSECQKSFSDFGITSKSIKN